MSPLLCNTLPSKLKLVFGQFIDVVPFADFMHFFRSENISFQSEIEKFMIGT